MYHKYFRMPGEWTAEQAWSVMEFIYQLEQLVWDTYEEQLLELVGPQGPGPPEQCYPDPDPDLNADPYDDIPF
jgi:hypothetical protein